MITALRPTFNDSLRGRAPHYHGKTFVYIGRLKEHTHLHSIDVWMGDRFALDIACDDEIFQHAKRRDG